MSYRPHGRASIDPSSPRALGICDRCGFRYNLSMLKWQYDWRGPKIQNLRILVCDECYDRPQQNGQRTIILPADPVPIENARPEFNVPDNNPLSALGANPSPLRWQFSNQIGSMVNDAGVPAAFDGNPNKPSWLSATISVSKSSYLNYVGINWTGNVNALSAPSSVLWPVRTHSLSSYTITAPNNCAIGSSAYVIQGSPVDASWGSWTTIASGSIAGTAGEVLSGVPAGGSYQFHRAAFYGDGVSQISVAQVSFSVNEVSSQ